MIVLRAATFVSCVIVNHNCSLNERKVHKFIVQVGIFSYMLIA